MMAVLKSVDEPGGNDPVVRVFSASSGCRNHGRHHGWKWAKPGKDDFLDRMVCFSHLLLYQISES